MKKNSRSRTRAPAPKRLSKLQEAAASVEVIQAAVRNSEAALGICQREVAQLEERLQKAIHNLRDTQGLLNAQEGKLQRELEHLRNLTYKAGPMYKDCALNEARVGKGNY